VCEPKAKPTTNAGRITGARTRPWNIHSQDISDSTGSQLNRLDNIGLLSKNRSQGATPSYCALRFAGVSIADGADDPPTKLAIRRQDDQRCWRPGVVFRGLEMLPVALYGASESVEHQPAFAAGRLHANVRPAGHACAATP
jgi:hypothetical protein